MREVFSRITPTPEEINSPLQGDGIVRDADVVMDRAFTLHATPDKVWPWFVQLGKNRAGWYLPGLIEKFIPKNKRALRHIEPGLQDLTVGDVIDDWGGRAATFEVAILESPHTLVYKSKRGKMSVSWSINLRPENDTTRVVIRLRLSPVKRTWLVKSGGELIDRLTIAGLEDGLRQRLGREDS